ncbi:MAG: SseB family protein [Paracoccaceae bacterium]
MTSVLDHAQAAMAASPGDEAAQLRFYHALADAGLFLLLEAEPEGERIAPRVFDLEDGPVILAFDSEERLASLGQGPVPYAVLPGRIIAQHLAGQGVSLGVNLGTGAPSEILLPPEALRWLVDTLDRTPEAAEARPEAFHPPGQLPPALMDALGFALGQATGLASGAVIAGVAYDDGRRGHMLAILDAMPGAEEALARAAAEALTFSGLEAGQMDVTFLRSDSAPAQAMVRAGLRLDIAAAQPEPSPAPKGPGTDPEKPPFLR